MAKINPYTNPTYAGTYSGVSSLAGVLTLLATTNASLTVILAKTTSTSGSLAKLQFKAGTGQLITSASV